MTDFGTKTQITTPELSRREVLKMAAGVALAAGIGGCDGPEVSAEAALQNPSSSTSMTAKSSPTPQATVPVVLDSAPLGFPWVTFDPFLFCAHHHDHYPAGTEEMGPEKVSLRGRHRGSDFSGKDGWSMYHGDVIPGFPSHPHRGFETVTLVRKGLIDHSDSLGAIARFGEGDAQWLTAGKGIVHSEMFPLIEREKDNPLELFQIWLNLPKAQKMVDPHFKMMWGETIPQKTFTDATGKTTSLLAVAGGIEELSSPKPPPSSWASNPEAALKIWSIEMSEGASWAIPVGALGLNRTLYFFAGDSVQVGERLFDSHVSVRLDSNKQIDLLNGNTKTSLLILEGKPIGEPVARRGPFVMNTHHEIVQAYRDYQRTQFGGWPWSSEAPVHSREKGRFAIHADGHEEHGEG